MRLLLLFCLSSFLGDFCWGWDHHSHLTRKALTKSVEEKLVPFVPFSEAVVHFGAQYGIGDRASFLEFFQLHKNYQLESSLAETPGGLVKNTQILETYSDEPDWGMDQNLFTEDQYPGLWTADTKYISQKEGLGSQGFRHMYFPGKFDFKRPFVTFQIPQRPLGHAPERAELFYHLAQTCFRAKQPYWGYRFLAWSLHYVQDLFQPFHVCQAPSLKLIQLKWKGIIPQIDIEQTGHQIAYYHLSYEKYVGDRAHLKRLSEALQDGSRFAEFSSIQDYLLNQVIPFSFSFASSLGRETRNLFPPQTFTPSFTVSEFVGSDEWEKSLILSEQVRVYSITEKLFRRMGDMTRKTVEQVVP